MAMAACPPNSFRFNSTNSTAATPSSCACDPGYLLDSIANNCSLFQTSPKDWIISSGIDYSISFNVPIVSFDSIKKFTQSQAAFLHATIALLVSWLLFCIFVRFRKIGDGKSPWFRVRWWISRLDVCYATRHWLDDQKVVKKRKTELGGTFSIASWILFIGLFAALLYQMISRRTVEIHNVRATNGPDLLSFINDMEFNITTISSMSCSHLRGLGNLVIGTPGSIEYRVSPLSTFTTYSCHNTSKGPTIVFRCSNCKISRDDLYVAWQFVDLPNDPAMAVGFQFNFTARNLRDRKRMSLVSGIVKNGSNTEERPITFRGPDVNILKFNLLPRIYRNLNDLRLIQPLFHEFIPGSSFLDASQLQASLQSSQNGLLNITLVINYLSSYIIEIDTEDIVGIVSFFADVGGLYAVSFAIFFFLLVQCEYRIKKLRVEDSVLRNIRNQTKAKQNWDKLRKYVIYTFNCSALEYANNINGEDTLYGCIRIGSSSGSRSLHRRKPSIQMDTISLNKSGELPIDTNTRPIPNNKRTVKSSSTGIFPNLEIPRSEGEHVIGHEDPNDEIGKRSEISLGSFQSSLSQSEASTPIDITLPLPPVLEYKTDSGADISDIQRNLKNLYDYNVLLREKLIDSQSMLEALTKRTSDPHCKYNT